MTPSSTPVRSVASLINAPVTHRRFDALARGSAVAVCREACLRLRSRYASCRACADSCPVQALQATQQTLALGADCTGCGRCQAVCPTAALSVEGFAPSRQPDIDRERGDAVTLDCWQVPSKLPSAGGIRVPCLGGVSVGRLLALCAAADPRPVVLADRGWCSDCASGGADHPARQTVERVASLMRQAGVPDARQPQLELQPLGADRVRRPRADPMLARGKSRRGFFVSLAGQAAEAPTPSAAARPRALPSAERQQTLQALQVFVTRYRGRMPASLFHRLEVRASCRGHRVCAAACPTGALLRYRDSGARVIGIAYDNSVCIGCGHCAAACPEQAIAIERGGGGVARELTRLNGLRQRECSDCGTSFALNDGDAEARCGNCRTAVHLAHSAFQTLFGARP